MESATVDVMGEYIGYPVNTAASTAGNKRQVKEELPSSPMDSMSPVAYQS